MSRKNLVKRGVSLVLVLLVLTGTATACTWEEFEQRTTQDQPTPAAGDAGTSTTPDDTSCEERAYENWVSEYGYTAHWGMDGTVRAIPNPDGFGEYLTTIGECSRLDNHYR